MSSRQQFAGNHDGDPYAGPRCGPLTTTRPAGALHGVVRVLLFLTCVVSAPLLVLSMRPGLLEEIAIHVILVVILTSVVWLPLGTLVVVLLLLHFHRLHRQGRLLPLPIRSALAIPAIALMTLALLLLNVPLRAAFLLSRSDFDRALASQPAAGIAQCNTRLGLYHVDEWATDPRGGVYFRVNTGCAGLGPDVTSYGFVQRPNRQGTPFGAAGYCTRHIVGDWYFFAVSDDWH